MFAIGDTDKIYGLAVIPDTVAEVDPLLYVSAQGLVPVKATLTLVLPPLHIVADPLTSLVGRLRMEMAALPVLSVARAVQL